MSLMRHFVLVDRHLRTHREVHFLIMSQRAHISISGWIRWQCHSLCIQPKCMREEQGRVSSHSVQVGGAEVIHFKGKINDTINTRLGHCGVGQGTIYTHCWQPDPCACLLLCGLGLFFCPVVWVYKTEDVFDF